MIPPERYRCLGELLRDSFLQYKTQTALIECDRKRESETLTYLEVMIRGERLARRLEDAGVGAGERVAIVMSNQSKWLIAAYAALYRGAVLVPIDFKLSGEEQAVLLRHCRPRVLVTEYPEWRDLPEALQSDAEIGLVIVSEVPEKIALPAKHVRYEDLPEGRGTFVQRERSDHATLVYSSGTGGAPKGCLLTHDNYLEQYRTLIALYPFEIGDRYFSVLPTNHAIDFMCGFLGPFACGATVVHQRSLRPEFVRWVMQTRRITHMSVVPLLLEAFERRITEQLEEKSEVTQHLFEGIKQLNASLTLSKPRRWMSRRLLKPIHDKIGPELKMLFCGGAFVDKARAQLFYDIGVPVVIGYGLTEACTVLTVNDMKPFRPDSVGKPLEGVEIEIRDPSDGVGEVWVKSRTVFAGYLDEPELTAEVLQDGWLRTGDRGYLDPSGQLHLVGRSKNMIVTAGGKNIHPEDIEGVFDGLDCEELVVFASGFVWPKSKTKDGAALTGEELVAIVRPKEGTELPAGALDDLRRRNQSLPDFKRVGAMLEWTDEFPRTASMKVKRNVLAEQLRDGADRSKLRRLST